MFNVICLYWAVSSVSCIQNSPPLIKSLCSLLNTIQNYPILTGHCQLIYKLHTRYKWVTLMPYLPGPGDRFGSKILGLQDDSPFKLQHRFLFFFPGKRKKKLLLILIYVNVSRTSPLHMSNKLSIRENRYGNFLNKTKSKRRK